MDPRIEIFMLKLVYIQNFTLVGQLGCEFYASNIAFFCIDLTGICSIFAFNLNLWLLSSIEFIFNLHIQVK